MHLRTFPVPARPPAPHTTSGAGESPSSVTSRRWRSWRVVLAVLALFVATLAFPAAAQAGELTTTVTTRTTSLGAASAMQYCGNARIGDANASVRTVVLVVHGDGRDACSYAGSTVKAARASGLASSTLVIAPHFLADSDAHGGRMFWSESGWKVGDASLDPGTLSSFTVVDRILAGITPARYPNLKRIVVAGHSAGGQFVNRYEAATPIETVTRYVVANPSSYLYFDTKRVNGTTLREPTRAERSACRRYNDYKYGLNGLNAYVGSTPTQALRNRFASRPTTLLLGTADTSRSNNIDTSCAADLQGRNRYARGHQYYDVYLPATFGSAVRKTHRVSDVPEVGHSWAQMSRSPQGRAALFTEPVG